MRSPAVPWLPSSRKMPWACVGAGTGAGIPAWYVPRRRQYVLYSTSARWSAWHVYNVGQNTHKICKKYTKFLVLSWPERAPAEQSAVGVRGNQSKRFFYAYSSLACVLLLFLCRFAHLCYPHLYSLAQDVADTKAAATA